MEANFFRFLSGELAAALTGQRIEKVHGPADGVLVFTLFGTGAKINLTFRPAKSAGLLFTTTEKPRNPFTAPARVMWLRKRLVGRQLLSSRVDWPNLRLAFSLSPRDVPGAGLWLVFDMLDDLRLAVDFPCPPEPVWPPLERILDDALVWRGHPQLTPPLRKHLIALARVNPGEAGGLVDRLASGVAEGFHLPPVGPPLAWTPMGESTQRFDSAMQASRAYGERALFTALGKDEDREQVDQAAAARKRLARQMALLDKDEARHKALAALAIPAEALQIALSGMSATPQAECVVLEHPAHGPQTVPLDPRLSPVENMAALFRQAAKGRRGLAHVERRRAELLAGAGLPPAPEPERGCAAPPARVAATLPKRYADLAVALFRTTDGFLALRGKSSQANHAMLSQAASPHDYWLHAAGGPSAHVILRRDYPNQPVPEQSLVEAAMLCALKSWRKDDTKAEVMCALVKDVRKVKGAAMGSVAVDEVERMLLVPIDPAIEARLGLEQPKENSPGSGSSKGRSSNKPKTKAPRRR